MEELIPDRDINNELMIEDINEILSIYRPSKGMYLIPAEEIVEKIVDVLELDDNYNKLMEVFERLKNE